jgi:hypothetical protein
MQRKLVSRISMVAIPIMIVCGLLVAPSSLRAAASSPLADDEDTKVCTNHTLHGDYGFALEGEILGPGLQFRGVVMQHYDGKGSFTQVDHIVFNGVPPAEEWTPGSGTYTVNPNCTGSAVIIVPGNPLSPINLHFVVVRQGKEIHQVVDANAVTAVGNKVE